MDQLMTRLGRRPLEIICRPANSTQPIISPLTRMIWRILFLLKFGIALANNVCPANLLRDCGLLMSMNMCRLYSESQFAVLNGLVMAPNARISAIDYNFTSGTCGQAYHMPMNEYFVRVFRLEHTCVAAIPVSSSIGTDNLVTVNGYGEFFVATQSKAKNILFIYTQPSNDCTLLLTSMLLRDVQCMYAGTPQPSSTNTLTSVTSTDTDTGGGSSGLSTTRMKTITASPFYDVDRYNSISITPGNGDDSFNNPVYHSDLKVCATQFGRFRVVMVETSHKYAALACVRKGFRIATIMRSDLGGAIGLVSSCLGNDRAAWIGEYWGRRSRPNQCLEVNSGSTPGTGSISIASSCAKPQAVLCEDPFFDLSI